MSTPTKAIGIDFGGTSIKPGIVDAGRLIAHGDVIDTTKYTSADAIIDALVAGIARMCEAHPDIAAVGAGLPGFVDSVGGVVHALTNVPGWIEVPLTRILRERTGLPAIIENDANAMAYGEFRHGAARGLLNVVCITLGTGVGGGLILDGRLYRGAQLAAGEPGHMSIDYQGKPGPYGNFGGLEEYVGNVQIAERAAVMYHENHIPKSEADCSPAKLAAAAAEGDPVARGVWETIGDEIGASMANIVWLLNPDAIVIGGGVAKAGEVLFEPIRKSIRSRTMKLFHESLRVVPAELGNDAGIIGCAELALEAVPR